MPNSREELTRDIDKFDWREVWYPVHYVEDLDKSQPTAFTLLERDLVIWWEEKAGCWRVFEDKCPHRLAPLSEGRINQEGLLECPYHGWTFSGEGKCESIPQQLEGGKAQSSPRACVTSLPTVVRQGLLFAYPGKPENAGKTRVPIVDPLEDSPEDWLVLNTFRDLPYDALTLLENVLDASHIPYTHHGTVGNRANAAPVELEIVESGKWGFKGVWEEGPRKGALGRQDTTFIAPLLMWHDLTSKQFGRTLTVVYATPISKGKCRLFARFPFKFASKIPAFFIKLTPRWYSHIGQNSILEDDQIFLHHQERYLEELGGGENFAKAFYLPTKADTFVVELRKWVNTYSLEPFEQTNLPPRAARRELLERYYSHTENCGSCSKALARIEKLGLGSGMVSAIALILSPPCVVYFPSMVLVTTVISLVAGAAWLYLSSLKRKFYQGQIIPPRNFRQ
jgi:phenylpropionate dioxygenase-like ring-hydroxylating dioxygenase large terminal subunit